MAEDKDMPTRLGPALSLRRYLALVTCTETIVLPIRTDTGIASPLLSRSRSQLGQVHAAAGVCRLLHDSCRGGTICVAGPVDAVAIEHFRAKGCSDADLGSGGLRVRRTLYILTVARAREDKGQVLHVCEIRASFFDINHGSKRSAPS